MRATSARMIYGSGVGMPKSASFDHTIISDALGFSKPGSKAKAYPS
jgi:hypothetical protein